MLLETVDSLFQQYGIVVLITDTYEFLQGGRKELIAFMFKAKTFNM
jgi:hypothetical protein